MNFAQTSALVTGANRGLGHAFVTELLALGVARIYAAVRRPETVAAAFPAEPRVVALRLDLTDLESVAAAVSAAPEIGLLVNNAATLEHGELLASDAIDVLDRAWMTNVRGPLALTRAFVPTLLRHPGAAIVQINSIAALCPFADVPAYAATKAAALSVTQALRRELAPRGVSVFNVMPGPLATEMAGWLTCPKADPRSVARAVLSAVGGRGAGFDLFPDAGAQAFWTDFKVDPARTLFVSPPSS